MQTLDLRGLKCPMPVLRTKKALASLAPFEELEVLTDDPHALEDIALFARQSGHRLLSQTTTAEKLTRHLLQRKP